MARRSEDRVWEGRRRERRVRRDCSFSTRFEDEPGTNPEALIAAAHASCFSRSATSSPTPESAKTTAKIRLRLIEGNPTISQIDLITEGQVPGIDEG